MKRNEIAVSAAAETNSGVKPRSLLRDAGDLAKVIVVSVIAFAAVLAILVPPYL